MFKKTVTFPDLDGNPVTEDFYFNLSVPEIAKMGASQDSNLYSMITSMTETTNGADILQALEAIVRLSVGKRSDDNRRFLKNDEITSEFFDSQAYEALYMELITDEDAMAEFVNNIIDMKKIEEVTKLVAARAAEGETTTDVELPDDKVPAWVAENRDATPAELQSMTKDQMVEAYRAKSERDRSALRTAEKNAPLLAIDATDNN